MFRYVIFNVDMVVLLRIDLDAHIYIYMYIYKTLAVKRKE